MQVIIRPASTDPPPCASRALRRVAAARSSHACAAPTLQGTPPRRGLAPVPAAFVFLPLLPLRTQKRQLKENNRFEFAAVVRDHKQSERKRPVTLKAAPARASALE